MKGACALLDAGMGGGVLQQLALEGNQISAHECTLTLTLTPNPNPNPNSNPNPNPN